MSTDFMDARDWQLLKLLQRDGRMSFAELGRRVKLTAPAATERVRRMEDRRVIRGYRAQVDLAVTGRPLRVFLRVHVAPKDYAKFGKVVHALEVVEECHHVTGGEAFVLKAAVADVAALEKLIQRLSMFGPTVTSVVLSTTLE